MPLAHDAIAAVDLAEIAATQHIQGREDMKEIIMHLLANFLRPRPTRREAELAYLNEAVSLYDLERREREIARGKFAGH